MKTRVQKWGNSLAVRIPSRIAEEAAIYQGAEVEVNLEDEGITVKPVKKNRNLDDLLSEVTEENRHSNKEWGTKGNESL